MNAYGHGTPATEFALPRSFWVGVSGFASLDLGLGSRPQASVRAPHVLVTVVARGFPGCTEPGLSSHAEVVEEAGVNPPRGRIQNVSLRSSRREVIPSLP